MDFNMKIKQRILVIIALMALFTSAKAITLNDISAFLLNPEVTKMTPKQLIEYDNFFSKLSVQLESEDEIILAVEKKPNSLEAAYIKIDNAWLLNDISFSYYSNKQENCDRQQNAYIKHLTKKLNNDTLSQSDDGVYWQLANQDWAIWLTTSYAVNPFTDKNGCSSKMSLIYSDLDAQSEDEDF